MKALGMMLLLVGVAGVVCATPPGAPEIDPGSAGSAVALLSGALMVIKSRKK